MVDRLEVMCLTARPNDHGGKAIKKKVKKYNSEEQRN